MLNQNSPTGGPLPAQSAASPDASALNIPGAVQSAPAGSVPSLFPQTIEAQAVDTIFGLCAVLKQAMQFLPGDARKNVMLCITEGITTARDLGVKHGFSEEVMKKVWLSYNE